MNLYAETSARRSRQVVADVAAIVGLLLCLWLGNSVHDATEQLASPGRSIESAGSDLVERMEDAAAAAADIPAVGDQLATPFDEARGVGQQIQDAGAEQQQVVATLATVLGWVAGGIPALGLLVCWLPLRLRFVRRAGEARGLRESTAGMDLLALRSLTRQPIRKLTRIKQPPATGWREQDPDVIAALAGLELRRLGVRATPPASASR